MVVSKLLHSGLEGIQDENVLQQTYLDNGSKIYWRLPSCFERLALLLNSPHYRYHALSGFVISAGK